MRHMEKGRVVILGAAGLVDLDATTATTVVARAKFRTGTWEYRHAPVVLRVDREPAFAGVDPYNKRIDRNSDDNVTKVE